MKEFDLDRIMARSIANSRRVSISVLASVWVPIVPAEPRRLSLMIAGPNDYTIMDNDRYRLYLKPDSSAAGPSSQDYGVMLWSNAVTAYSGLTGPMTPQTDAGAVQTFSLDDDNAVPPTPNHISGTGTFAATLTPVYFIDVGNQGGVLTYDASAPLRLTLRDDGDVVRMQWWGRCVRHGSDLNAEILVAESLARPDDCGCWMGEAAHVFPR